MNTKGRILIRSKVFPYSESAGGGAEKLMRNIASALVDTGWTVDTLSPYPDTDDPDTPEDINYHFFEYPNPSSPVTRLLNSFRGARTFRNLIEEVSYDVIVDDVSHLPFYPAHFLCNGETTNAIFLHTGFFNRARNVEGAARGTVVELVERTLPYLNTPEIICAGPSTRQQVESHTGYENTAILNPCIDIEAFEYEFNPDSKMVLSLGRLTHRKNISCLISAWEEVEQTHPDYELLIAGSGPEEEQLREKVQQAGLSTVTFAGFVDEQKKHQLYQEALLFALPSLLEGYVTTGLEALASGTPVVGSDTPGIHDYVSPGENGFLFPTNDSHALAETLKYAFDNRDELETMAKQGRELAENHSYEHFKTDTDALFTELRKPNTST